VQRSDGGGVFDVQDRINGRTLCGCDTIAACQVIAKRFLTLNAGTLFVPFELACYLFSMIISTRADLFKKTVEHSLLEHTNSIIFFFHIGDFC